MEPVCDRLRTKSQLLPGLQLPSTGSPSPCRPSHHNDWSVAAPTCSWNGQYNFHTTWASATNRLCERSQILNPNASKNRRSMRTFPTF